MCHRLNSRFSFKKRRHKTAESLQGKWRVIFHWIGEFLVSKMVYISDSNVNRALWAYRWPYLAKVKCYRSRRTKSDKHFILLVLLEWCLSSFRNFSSINCQICYFYYSILSEYIFTAICKSIFLYFFLRIMRRNTKEPKKVSLKSPPFCDVGVESTPKWRRNLTTRTAERLNHEWGVSQWPQ